MYEIILIIIALSVFLAVVLQIIEFSIKRIRKNRNKKSDEWLKRL